MYQNPSSKSPFFFFFSDISRSGLGQLETDMDTREVTWKTAVVLTQDERIGEL